MQALGVRGHRLSLHTTQGGKLSPRAEDQRKVVRLVVDVTMEEGSRE